jgi:hypothetical protein
MSSSRIAVLLLVLGLVAPGCKKKPPASDMEAGAAEPADAAPATDEASAADTGAADSAADVAASDAAQGDDGGADEGDDGGPSTVAPGVNFAGGYSCFGTLTLRQVGNTVSGDAVARQGGKTLNNDVTCKIRGDKCSGQMNHFKTGAGGAPKPEGKSKITFRIVAGGLEYTEGGGGSGFCKRN